VKPLINNENIIFNFRLITTDQRSPNVPTPSAVAQNSQIDMPTPKVMESAIPTPQVAQKKRHISSDPAPSPPAPVNQTLWEILGVEERIDEPCRRFLLERPLPPVTASDTKTTSPMDKSIILPRIITATTSAQANVCGECNRPLKRTIPTSWFDDL
jgi:hypothetical protein